MYTYLFKQLLDIYGQNEWREIIYIFNACGRIKPPNG